ncbi:NAD-dependent epimerase/dehydratase family protein [Gammaproteobacteria bacterium]|nr:NAD-dependent epimerase/dehydratase family protein [Gammaproteobacteria bacterium]
MTSLITGASGFIGSSLIDRLDENNQPYVAITSEDGDLSKVEIEGIIDEKNYDNLIHLASRTFVPSSWESPESFINENIASTLNILKFSRKNQIPIIFLSAYIYGPQEFLPIREDAEINISNPYAVSKYLSEELCKYFSNQYQMDITILRPFNIYGPGQKSQFLIPEIIEQLKKGNSVCVNSLSPKRDYLYIDDLIDAILMTSVKQSGLQIYNIGYGESISVLDLLKKIENILEYDLEIIEREIIRKNEINDVIADISSITNSIGWKPTVKLSDGLRKILRLSKLC